MLAPRRLSSWARQTSSLLAQDVLKPPIHRKRTTTPESCEDDFPHAETSAAGAARYDRLLRHQVTQPLGPRGAQPGARLFSTCCCNPARYAKLSRKNLNASPPSYLPELERGFAEYEYQVRKETQTMTPTSSDMESSPFSSSSIGWQTPAELSRHPVNVEISALSSTPRNDPDRDLVSRSIFRHQLLIAYDFLEDLHRQVGLTSDKDELNREKLPAQLGAVVEVVAYVAGVRGTRGRRSPPILPADATAFRIVLSLLVHAQIKLGFRTDNIIGLLGDMRKVCPPLLVPSYHQLLAAAGVRGRYDLVESLWQDAYTAWAKSTDEWMLYARARAWASQGKWQDLKSYWHIYDRCSLAPPEAYGRLPKRVNFSRKLHPPHYLFTLLLEAQIDSQRQFSKMRQSFAGAKAILRAMRDHGYEVGQPEWLLLLKASPNLRIRLPDLLQGDHSAGQQRSSIVLALLRARAHDLAVRDVIKLLRLTDAEQASASRKLSGTSKNSIYFSVSPSEKVEALSIAAAVFGKIGHPERARRCFEACRQLASDDQDLQRCTRAAVATLIGYRLARQHDQGLVFGKHLVTDTATNSVESSPMSNGRRSILGALLELAADIEGDDETFVAVRSLLDLAKAEGIDLNNAAMRKSLIPLFFRAIGTANNDLSGIFRLYADLKSAAYRLDPHSDEVQPRLRLRSPAQPRRAMDAEPSPPISIANKSRHRLRLLLQTVQASGFEDALILRDRGRNARKLQRAAYYKVSDPNDEAEESAEWLRSNDGPSISHHNTMTAASEESEEWTGSHHDAARHHDTMTAESKESDEWTGSHHDAAPPDSQAMTAESEEWSGSHYDAAPHHDTITAESEEWTGPHHDAASRHAEWMQAEQTNTGHHHHPQEEEARPPIEDSSSPVDPLLEDELDSQSLTSAGYAMRLRVYSVLRRDHHSTAFIYQHMTSTRGIRPTMFHIAPIVEGLCQDGRVDEARGIAQQAQRSFKVLTTLRVQTSICRALVAVGRDSEALRDYREWIDLGGKPDPQLQAILTNLGLPRFASHSALLEAIELAQQDTHLPSSSSSMQVLIQSILPLSEIDAAFRYLMSIRRYLSAQQIIWWALKFTDFRMDTNLRIAVRDSKNLIRKIYGTKERQLDFYESRPDGAARAQGIQVVDAQTTRRLISFSELDLSQLVASMPSPGREYVHGPDEGPQEDTLPLLGEALRVQAAIMDRSGPVNAEWMAKLASERKGRATFRKGLRDLVFDVVGGKWSLERTSEKRQMRARRFQKRNALTSPPQMIGEGL